MKAHFLFLMRERERERRKFICMRKNFSIFFAKYEKISMKNVIKIIL